MSKSRHLALLRGINVGGNNVITMSALRDSFEAMGFEDTTTYIQSGNVIFTADGGRRSANKTHLTIAIEAALSKTFGYQSKVVVLTADELERVGTEAPPKFGAQPDRYRYDVLFVKEPLTAKEALEQVTTKPGVDTVHAGAHALYFRRLIASASQSHLVKIVQRPVYKSLTIRNWNTTRKLLAMLSA